jgi:hypothetical protein
VTVDETYQLMKDIVLQNQNGYLRPSVFNEFINRGQYGYANYLIGEFQRYLPGRPMAAVEFGQNQDIRQRLTPFIKPPVTLTINGAGLAPYPADYEASDAVYYGQYNRPVKYIQQDRLGSHINSRIDPVATNPVYLINSDGLQFYPINLGAAKFSYINTPPAIVWNFDTDANGRAIYNPVGSVDPMWYELDMMDIISRALEMMGVRVSSSNVQQYAQRIKQQGQ